MKIYIVHALITVVAFSAYISSSASEDMAEGFGIDWATITPQKTKQIDAKMIDKGGKTPLHFAAASSPHPDVINTLINAGIDPRELDNNANTSLHYAAASNPNPDVITALMNAGARPTTKGIYGKTPLHLAAESNPSLDVVTTLIHATTQFDIRNNQGETPLHNAAASNTSLDVITALLNTGANLHEINVIGLTPGQYAASYNTNPDVVSAFIRAGVKAQVKDRDKHGRTYLHFATAHNLNSDVIMTIIKSGIDPNVSDTWSNTPLHNAASHSENNRSYRYSRSFSDISTMIHYTILRLRSVLSRKKLKTHDYNPSASIAILIKAGASLEARNDSGLTPLLLAAKESLYPDSVTSLIEAGADINAKNGEETFYKYLKKNKKLMTLHEKYLKP